jgi:guanylate kinase
VKDPVISCTVARRAIADLWGRLLTAAPAKDLFLPDDCMRHQLPRFSSATFRPPLGEDGLALGGIAVPFGHYILRSGTRARTMGKGLLFVISAPSGAGKSTLIERIRPLFPDMLYSVSCTTRRARTGEIDGVHYYFLGTEQFRNMIEGEQFLEWKEVHGNLYGTPADPVKQAIKSGRRMILDIDVQGAAEVLKNFAEAVGIFISAPSPEVLEHRLRARGTDSEDSIRIRLHNAHNEMKRAGMFRHVVVNDDLDAATQRIAAIIGEESAADGANAIQGTSR